MSEIDSDDDGFIDFHEFADFHRRESDNGDENRWKWIDIGEGIAYYVEELGREMLEERLFEDDQVC
ncbi:hypothetical protein ACSBR2_028458 [Camellia fascicularis]